MIFGAKKIEVNRVEDNSRQDLALITQMNQELAGSLDLKETLQNALETIIKRINAQAAKGAVEAVILNGRRFDCGSVQGYLDAIKNVADCREH